MQTTIPGVRVSKLERHEDERGFFMELGRESAYGHLPQGNLSFTRAGALRGMHYHRNQGDLWVLIEGRLEVALADLRYGSEGLKVDYGVLDSHDAHSLFIPPGVAHGYAALTDATLVYLVTQEFDGSDEYGVAWDDPQLDIPWQTTDPLLSKRDQTNGKINWADIRTS